MEVSLSDLEDAFDFVSNGILLENQAWLCKKTGKFFFSSSEVLDEDEENSIGLPKDADLKQFISIPNKKELNLGKNLVMDFAHEFCNEELHLIQRMFSGKGAYSKFKSYLENKDKLDEWYQYEADAQKSAYEDWCKGYDIQLKSE